MRHPLATTMALLMLAAQREHRADYDGLIAHLIDGLLSDWSDNKKADLYALLVESVLPDDGLSVLDGKVNRALLKNEEHFRG